MNCERCRKKQKELSKTKNTLKRSGVGRRVLRKLAPKTTRNVLNKQKQVFWMNVNMTWRLIVRIVIKTHNVFINSDVLLFNFQVMN